MINKSLPPHSRLTRTNTFDHARDCTAAQYFTMHIARLLCHMALHWECMPFLPLRYTQPEGPQRLKNLYHRSTKAPAGFWKSSAREFFGAARSVLDLAADAREVGCLTMSGFALYGIFTAKFTEIYAKAFPWMDPEHAATDEHHWRDASHGSRPIALSRRPYLSYTAEIEGINDTLHIAQQWVETLDSIATYFDTFKQDFAASVTMGQSHSGEPENHGVQAAKCLRDGGPGEGDEEFELFRHRLCDYSKL